MPGPPGRLLPMWLRSPRKGDKKGPKTSPRRSPLAFLQRGSRDDGGMVRMTSSKSQLEEETVSDLPPPMTLITSVSQVSGEEKHNERDNVKPRGEDSLFFPMEMDEYGTTVGHPGSSPKSPDGDIPRSWLEHVADFLLGETCYKLMPSSTKVVVLDSGLSVKQAFHALIAHDVGLGPCFNSEIEAFIGMFTCVDFIDILTYYYHESPIHDNIGKNLEEDKIQEWKDTERENDLDPDFPRGLVSIDPSSSLYTALSIMQRHHIHVLPLVDLNSASNVLGMVRMSQILQLIVANIGKHAKVMQATVKSLGIGTFKPNLVIATKDTPLIEVFKSFSKRRMTGIPLVDNDGVLVGVYERSDVMNLAIDGTFHNLDQHVYDVWKTHQKPGDAAWKHTCSIDEGLESVIYKLASRHLHRVVCVDEEFKPIGVISLSDVLAVFLVYGQRLETSPVSSPKGGGFWSPKAKLITLDGRERSGTNTSIGSTGVDDNLVPMSLPRELQWGTRPSMRGPTKTHPPRTSPLNRTVRVERMASDVGPPVTNSEEHDDVPELLRLSKVQGNVKRLDREKTM